jgi:tetratricopeptide (TPR) repeat protein
MVDPIKLANAITLHQKGELQKADAIYSSLLATTPNHLQSLCLSGSIAQQCGDHSRAIELFKRAKHLNPNLSSIYLQLGISYSAINEIEAGNLHYLQALQLSPDQVEPIVNLANNLTRLNRFQDAFELYKKALLLSPNSATIHYNIGTMFLKSMKPEDAQFWLEKTVALQENHANAWNSLGVALTEFGNLEGALEAYNMAIKLEPTLIEPYFNIHAALIDLGKPQEAITNLEQALKLDPFHNGYRFFLGIMKEYFSDESSGSEILRSLAQEEDVKAELESWEHLKSLNIKSATLVGTNTRTIELALREAKLEGTILEFGVYNGKSIRNIASLVDSVVYGFDSFQGIPENWNDEPAGSYSANGSLPKVPSNVVLFQGWFEETIPQFIQSHVGPIRFMNIDCDLYSSTKTIFDALGNYILPGTVIVFDEYIGYKSWKNDEFKAFQEAIAQYGWQYEVITFSFASKQVAVKII